MIHNTWPHFSEEELCCRCGCGLHAMDRTFMAWVEHVRERYGQPMHVSSAFRCPDHNAAVSSTGRQGPHTTGKAIDIRIYGRQAHQLMTYALHAGVFGLGVAQRGLRAERFVHLDMLLAVETQGPRPWCWTY